MKRANLKYLVPNGVTFASLALGMGAVLAAAEERLVFAGTLIFVCYWLDMLDGLAARKLNAQSSFGLQLDSLVDMISFGAAPGVLAFQYLRLSGIELMWVTPAVIGYVVAGAFRLARFNLLPPKTSGSKDSVGLAITQGGGTLVLALLAALVESSSFLPAWTFIPMIWLLSVLEVSMISFPPITWFFLSSRKFGIVLLIVVFLMIALLPTFSTWFWIYIFYLAVSISRSIYRQTRKVVTA
jgi:CDP-diacylglycerol--serine O-phosphatidyltransferase